MNSNIHFLGRSVDRFTALNQEVLRELEGSFLSFLLVVEVLEAAVLAQGTRHASRSVGISAEQSEKLVRLSVLHLDVEADFRSNL